MKNMSNGKIAIFFLNLVLLDYHQGIKSGTSWGCYHLEIYSNCGQREQTDVTSMQNSVKKLKFL